MLTHQKLVALTRAVSRSLASCELTHLARHPIDLVLARQQHHAYEDVLRSLGIGVISLPEQPDLPDAVFVEDPLLVFDELAIVTRPGAPSRRPEAESLAAAIQPCRPLARIEAPATLDGGDILCAGRDVFAGLSTRTSAAGIAQLSALLQPFGYRVRPVEVRGCLHLKSAACSLGERRLLVNRAWLDTTPLSGYELVDVPTAEPEAANVLRIGNTVLLPAAFPRTRAIIEALGLRTVTVDISELMKAEAAITCSSVVFTL